MSDQESKTIDEIPISEVPINTERTSNEIYDRLVLLESKITEFIQLISTSRVAQMQLANNSAESIEPADPSNQTNTSTEPDLGAKLYDRFKTEIQDTLVWLIEHDPSAELFSRSLPCTLADLCEKWRSVLYKIQDDSLREKMFQTLDLLN